MIFNCPAELTIHLIGGRWKSALLIHLWKGSKRFGELRRLSPGITQATLSKELRDLEKNGIIKRAKLGRENYQGVEYSLTEKGQSLKPILKAIIKWGFDHQKDHVVGNYKIAAFQN